MLKDITSRSSEKYEEYTFDALKSDIEDGETFISDKIFSFQIEKITRQFPKLPELEFRNCEFDARVIFNFDELEGVSFSTCTFNYYLQFHNSTLGHLYFDDCNFKDYLSINSVDTGHLNFVDCSFLDMFALASCVVQKNAFFCDVNFSKADIRGVKFTKGSWFQDISIENYLQIQNIECETGKLLLDRVPVEKISFTPSQLSLFTVAKIDWPSWAAVSSAKVLDVAMCRSWKMFLRSMGDEWAASNWHHFEKELALKRLSKGSNKISFCFLKAYGLLSCFGESPERAFNVLVVLVCLPFVFSLIHTLPEIVWGETYASYALGFIPLLSKAAAAKTVGELSVLEKCTQIVWQGLITVQASLLALAVRNKVRR